MLQPRRPTMGSIFMIFLIFLSSIAGFHSLESTPRLKRETSNDVTTVLLVDNQGRNSFGRFVNVKPDLGLITSTARTFIQEGVTTEYATQVLGTTLDNGRLYAHLLTKSSRVLYDSDSITSRPNFNSQNVNLDQKSPIPSLNFVKNTDYVTPRNVEPYVVFPTISAYESHSPDITSKEIEDEESLQLSPSNNARIPYPEVNNWNNKNVKVFQITPKHQYMQLKNFEDEAKSRINEINDVKPSKVRPQDDLPTFTVRNEFSPSGFSILGDWADFDTVTERSKPTTASERKAKFLLRAGVHPKKDLTTVTYKGFADFTTTVGDTVIVFAPHTPEVPRCDNGKVTSISVEATLKTPISSKIRPTFTLSPSKEEATSLPTSFETNKLRPGLTISTINRDGNTKIRPFPSKNREQQLRTLFPKIPRLTTKQPDQSTTEEVTEESTEFAEEDEDQDITTESISKTPEIDKSMFPTKVIDAKDRTREMQIDDIQQHEDLDAKMSVLAHEQKVQSSITKESEESIDDTLSPQVIQPSQTQTPMLTTPSEEDIAKILASLQSHQNSQPTTPLSITTSQQISVKKSSTPITLITTHSADNAATLSIPSQEDIAKILASLQNQQNTRPTESLKSAIEISSTKETKVFGGATTIFFDNDPFATPVFEETPSSEQVKIDQKAPKTEEETEKEKVNVRVDENSTATTPSIITTVNTEKDIDTESLQKSSTTEQETESHTTVTEISTTDSGSITVTDETFNDTTTESQGTSETESDTIESESDTTESNEEESEDDEIEVIYKTLYTTYTYLTTYYEGDSSSIDSRKEVITNVITSTVDPSNELTDSAVAGLLEREDNLVSGYKSRPPTFDDIPNIVPTSALSVNPTSSYNAVNEDDNDNRIPDLEYSKPTSSLEDAVGVKTYYTTYTYFTTIFVDGETEISSRTEVYTNFVTPSINPSSVLNEIIRTSLPIVTQITSDKNDKDEKEPLEQNSQTTKKEFNSDINKNTTPKLDDNLLANLNEYSAISTVVRSSTSSSRKRIIDNNESRNILDDQIVAESNNESEIMPSPTLYLQTSYTTFTYFTTVYQGTAGSTVKSRLETITNVVTETVSPTKALETEDPSEPITYFTTFTYWTTFFKDGSTSVTSREETISNVVNPTSTELSGTPAINISPISITSAAEILPTKAVLDQQVIETPVENLTTYYTTYTYYTTSFIGNDTILNSRLETITNVVNGTSSIDEDINTTVDYENSTAEDVKDSPVLEGLLSSVTSTVENGGIKTLFSTGTYGTHIDGVYAQIVESTSSILSDSITPTPTPEQIIKPTGVVSLNQGKIVDADGVSTLFFNTQAIGTIIDGSYAQVIESSSSLKIDEDKKAALAATSTPSIHRTGLVRIVDGSIIQNDTTTLYQSKVIGTLIDGRYAQIIESTSSFIVDKTEPPTIKPTTVNVIGASVTDSSFSGSPAPASIEGSIGNNGEENITEDEEEEEQEDEEDDDDERGRKKSRLTFQTRKRTFTPAIRPFASRTRSTFSLRRKNLGQTTAATITRSDFTPTVTAVPAGKTGARFGSRRSSTNIPVQPTPSGGRRFARPKSTSPATGSKGKSQQKIQATSGPRKGFRSSSAIKASSSYAGNSRFARIRPTAVNSGRISNTKSNSLPSNEIIDEANDLTTQITESPDDVTNQENDSTQPLTPVTEPAKRAQNPLLRFRRPPFSRPSSTTKTPTTTKSTSRNAKSLRAPTTPRSTGNNRPVSSIQARRPGSNLFPRRNLFTTTTTTTEPEKDEQEEELQLEDENQEGEEDEDTDYESSNTETQTAKSPVEIRNADQNKENLSKKVSIRPFRFRQRSKRDTLSRFRRPRTRQGKSAENIENYEPIETTTTKPTKPSRFKQRSRYNFDKTSTSTPRRISPSRTTQSRSQFTLRKDDNKSNFRRPSSQYSSTRRTTTPASRPKPPRLRTSQTEPTTTRKRTAGTKRGSTTKISSRGSTIRSRYSAEQFDVSHVRSDNRTITVTHQVPTEVTIPVVNGRVTEYKNIITAQFSTEVIPPHKYTTALNSVGNKVTVLLSENTGINGNGATAITRFILNETPTTSVTFTPTFIRGYKTSYSHIIPSTAYGVEQVVSTIQPQLSPQAPLANLLLSQLLLGNAGLQANPLLGLQNAAAAAPTPTTEYKTRSTSYVTTVVKSTSTVLPITFRGKEILTTIIDSSNEVVTATEFITDTIVSTPTMAPGAQLNSLLLPLLIQQQQLQSAQPFNPLQTQGSLLFGQNQKPSGVFGLNFDTNTQQFAFQDLRDNFAVATKEYDNISKQPEDFQSLSDEDDAMIEGEVSRSYKKKSSKKTSKKDKEQPSDPSPVLPSETSVVTLYVSGKTPDEFTTILSTVVVGEENKTKSKREAVYIEVKPSNIENNYKTNDKWDVLLTPVASEAITEENQDYGETASLESVVGDVEKYITTHKPDFFVSKPTKWKQIGPSKKNIKSQKKTGNFLEY